MKLEINNRRETGKSTNTCKHHTLEKQWVKGESKNSLKQPKWKHNISKPVGHRKSSAKREVETDKWLHF